MFINNDRIKYTINFKNLFLRLFMYVKIKNSDSLNNKFIRNK